MLAEFRRYPYDALQHRMSQPGGLGGLSETLAASLGLLKQPITPETGRFAFYCESEAGGGGWVLSRNLGGGITTQMG